MVNNFILLEYTFKIFIILFFSRQLRNCSSVKKYSFCRLSLNQEIELTTIFTATNSVFKTICHALGET